MIDIFNKHVYLGEVTVLYFKLIIILMGVLSH